jgi:hypothetical protein
MASIALRLVMLLAFAASMLAGCKRTPSPYSSPTALRDTNAYVKAIAPVPPGAIDATFFDQTSVGIQGSTLSATNLNRSESGDASGGFHNVIKRLEAGEKLVREGASFEMVSLSVSGPGATKTPKQGKKRVPLDYFAPDGRSLTPEELTAMGFNKWRLEEYVGNNFNYIWDSYPDVKVWFGAKTQQLGHTTPVGLLNAQTRLGLVGGHSYSQISSNGFGFSEVRPRAWHAVPMDLVMDVELNGQTAVDTNASPGITVTMPGGVVRMLGILSGRSGSWSSSSGSASGAQGTQVTQINLPSGDASNNTVALFVTEPEKLAVHVELLGEQGRAIEASGGGTSGSLRVVGVHARAENVRQVRFAVFTNHHRVIIPVPTIPNLPPACQNATKLFEVPIPIATIQRECELRNVVQALTQMNFRYPPGGDLMPPDLLPMTVANVIPAGLIAICQRSIAKAYMLVVEEAKQEFRFEMNWHDRFKQWLQRKLRL